VHPQVICGLGAHESVCPANSISFGPVGLRESVYISMMNFVNFGRTVAEIWRLSYFKHGGRPPSWII